MSKPVPALRILLSVVVVFLTCHLGHSFQCSFINEKTPLGHRDGGKVQRTSIELRCSEKATEGVKPYFVRKALFADLAQAGTILTDGFYPQVNPIRFFMERLRTILSLESTYPRQDAAHEIFVACLDELSTNPGQVIAVAEVDNRPTNQTNLRRPYMCNVAVDRRWRKKGLAKAMIRQCEEEAIGWGEGVMYLKVKEQNKAARRLYEKLGYKVESQEVDEKQGDVLLLMSKSLVPVPVVHDALKRQFYETSAT